jgi:hypothetical protein
MTMVRERRILDSMLIHDSAGPFWECKVAIDDGHLLRTRVAGLRSRAIVLAFFWVLECIDL